MSEKTRFRGTERILFERKQLHGLVDFFWQHMDYTRDDVYDMIRTILGQKDIVHISDMTQMQIRIVAGLFHSILENRNIAPCKNCVHAGYRTPYGLIPCARKGSKGFFWMEEENAVQPRRCAYAKLRRSFRRSDGKPRHTKRRR